MKSTALRLTKVLILRVYLLLCDSTAADLFVLCVLSSYCFLIVTLLYPVPALQDFFQVSENLFVCVCVCKCVHMYACACFCVCVNPSLHVFQLVCIPMEWRLTLLGLIIVNLILAFTLEVTDVSVHSLAGVKYQYKTIFCTITVQHTVM